MEPVIIIHGTFANEATWWRPDGDFCRLLDKELRRRGSTAKCWDSIPAEEAISEFGWSGLNSEASRSHAAELLSKKVESLSRNPFIEKIHFVAHSHGGNVLLKAFLLCRREIDNRKLGSFVFLGTPFLEYRSMNPPGSFWRHVRTRNEIMVRYGPNRNPGGIVFVIQSKHDEAYQLLSKAVHLRNSCSRLFVEIGAKVHNWRGASANVSQSSNVAETAARQIWNHTHTDAVLDGCRSILRR
jgi:pimeloyl-ACP methyl ester carboxylesterase